MLTVATNWTTISSLATGVGTLVLAIATFASVRSANRSARVAEEALIEQRRPILTQSRPDDPVQKIMFVEQHWVVARGGHGVAEHDGSLYFALSLRNVGEGIGVCQAWHVAPLFRSAPPPRDHTPVDQFRLQTRDLYIPAGDIGMWQGALRDRNDATFQAVAEAIDNQGSVSVELLYSDQVGEQRTISRFALIPYETRDEEGRVRIQWFAAINRHWYLDRAGPRSDDQVAAATDVVLRDREAAERLAEAETEAAEAEDEEAVEVEVAASAEPDQRDRAEADGAARGETDGAGPGQADEAAPARVGDAQPISVIPRPNCE